MNASCRKLRWIALLGTLGLVNCGSADNPAADARPNILLIVADDLGYADIGAFGSDIDTPNIDLLASSGIRFTQFRTAPSCAPTRAMLLSGNNNHVAGVARQGMAPGLAGHPVYGYEHSLSDRIAPLPALLKESGYHTYMAGKWHLGMDSEHWPVTAGFERSFGLTDGAGTHFDARGFYEGGARYFEDDRSAEWPEGRYSTEVYTDKLIEFIESNREDGKPFFAYAAYTSPHWPLQVPDEYLDLYKGRYDDGYDALRESNFAALKEADIIADDMELRPRNDAVRPWEDLDADERRRESRKMELYAAMVDNLDDEIGRLLGFLRENGLFDNTLIVFMSDNGAASSDFYNSRPPMFTEYVRANFDNAYELMGTAASFVSYGIPWAEAGSVPFHKHKMYTREGGIAAPMIITGPGVSSSDVIARQYVTVMDLAPTFLEVGGASYPDDGSVRPMLGESMLPLLTGEADRVHDDAYVTLLSHWGRAFIRQGEWKMSTLEGPFEESRFELFNLAEDLGETTDLRQSEPEKYGELLQIWRQARREYGIILPEDL